MAVDGAGNGLFLGWAGIGSNLDMCLIGPARIEEATVQVRVLARPDLIYSKGQKGKKQSKKKIALTWPGPKPGP
ncbi:hypothetical protein AMTR_s00005p00098760 [Amborella trichopoda]|uniref:Uncharacterized protein n=1 Tax=Amborella trichopoda TaxID=13333 RepID=W1PI25_AMBTC|nr:hypothetical protein AMTR_s00005p00098760 [Amborella trichopoda]